MSIDSSNRKLLGALRRDSRAKYAELGKTVNLSAPAVFERVKKLEGSGVIQRYTVELDPTALGLPFCAFVQIATTGRCSCEKLAETLTAYPEVEECHSIAGENSVLVKVRTATPLALDQLLQKMRRISGVERTLTTVVLQTHFERGVQPPA